MGCSHGWGLSGLFQTCSRPADEASKVANDTARWCNMPPNCLPATLESVACTVDYADLSGVSRMYSGTW